MEPGEKREAISAKAGIKKIITVALLCAISFTTNAQIDFCSAKNSAFQPGERITFNVYYNMGFIWIYAGDCVFSVKTSDYFGTKAYYFSGDGRTAKSYEWFYKVRDLYESYVDSSTLMPLRFIRNVAEGGLKYKHDATFFRNINRVTDNGKGYDMTPCTQDVLSAVYFARNIDYSKYQPGDKIPFDMFLDDKVYNLYIKYLGKEKVETKKGTFNSIKIVPLLIDGTMFKGGEGMAVWVSDDKNHIPLRISSPIVIGSIKADLMDYQGLRNPFDAIISLK